MGIAIVDSYVEANQDSVGSLYDLHPAAGGAPSAYGQTFTGDGSAISSCKFYFKVQAGTPGSLTARLYAHSGTWGSSGVPTGGALDSSTEKAVGGVGGTLVLVEFVGFAGYKMVNGTRYCIDIEATTEDWNASHYVQVGHDNSSPTHSGNGFNFNSGAWASQGYDNIFYVYGLKGGRGWLQK